MCHFNLSILYYFRSIHHLPSSKKRAEAEVPAGKKPSSFLLSCRLSVYVVRLAVNRKEKDNAGMKVLLGKITGK